MIQQKQFLQIKPDLPIVHMVAGSAVIAAVSELVYFLVKRLLLDREPFSAIGDILLVTLIAIVLLTLLAAAVAVEIKQVKGIIKHLPLVLMGILFVLLKDYLKK